MTDSESAAIAEPAAPPSPRKRNSTELVATVLLSVAAVATAWSSYQATRWNGEQARAAGRTGALRSDAARAQGLAQAQTEVDIATFVQWINARAAADTELEDFYEDRFRDEFKPAFEAWLATDPFTDPDAPPTPFAIPEYRLAAADEADAADVAAEASAATVAENIQRSANYVLGVVLFTVSLFFAGMSTKLQSQRLRLVMLTFGCLLFLGTLTWIATFPVRLSV